MIARTQLNELAQEWGLAERVVEKDYVIGWVLWGIANHPLLQRTWAFKGGTCLKKCYVETYRFSEDLDFTIMEGGPLLPHEVAPIIEQILERITEEAGIDFSGWPPRFKQHGAWPSVEGRIYYRGPRQTPNAESIKLDLLSDERVVRPTVLRPITHPYTDKLPDLHEVRCYSFEEVFAEKLRALGERCRSRDLYDVVNLYRRRDLQTYPDLIREVLVEKCTVKGVSVPTLALVDNSPFRAEVESEWKNMLEHQLPALPPFSHYWEELANLFDWLEGKSTGTALAPVPADEDEDNTWQPPATIWAWGIGTPLEVVRFAGVNHLCVELGYQGSRRIIEPYSLRRTRDGHYLLHAVRADNRQHRSYRVDRIESVKVTNQPFQPVYLVEFGQSGPLSAPPTPPRRSKGWPSFSTSRYVIECPRCGRQFKRNTPDRKLRPHKDKNGFRCGGTLGYHV